MNSREKLIAIFEAAIDAVKPDQALLSHLEIHANKLFAGNKEYPLDKGRIFVVAAGKGAAPMAKALEDILGNRIQDGAVVVKYGHGLPLSNMEVIEASHPVPDSEGEKGAKRLLELAAEAGPDDLLICLLTGGASSLLPSPGHGLALTDLQAVTERLLASGATIAELNVIRKHLSQIAGGQLAKAAGGAKVLSVIVSDVIGDSLDVIASGPTAPDSSTWQDCAAIVDKYNLTDVLPARVTRLIEDGAKGNVPETPKPGELGNVTNIIVANNNQAIEAAAAKAKDLGYKIFQETAPMQGEARITARELIERAKNLAAVPGNLPFCMLAGGETTVTLKGHGLGGRNQEMALAASLELEHIDNIHALFAGTDGTDGPTDAAGGFADAKALAAMGTKAKQWLEDNDSYHALEEAESLYKTGPTRTNVMDLAIILAD